MESTGLPWCIISLDVHLLYGTPSRLLQWKSMARLASDDVCTGTRCCGGSCVNGMPSEELAIRLIKGASPSAFCFRRPWRMQTLRNTRKLQGWKHSANLNFEVVIARTDDRRIRRWGSHSPKVVGGKGEHSHRTIARNANNHERRYSKL